MPALTVDLPVIGSVAIPGAGTEALTFIVTIVFLVIFGEVIPKRLAKQYPLWFIRRLHMIIRLFDIFFGWLGMSFQSIVDIPAYVIRKIINNFTKPST
jgi:CBS domain containing-hemolysin-like protein